MNIHIDGETFFFKKKESLSSIFTRLQLYEQKCLTTCITQTPTVFLLYRADLTISITSKLRQLWLDKWGWSV